MKGLSLIAQFNFQWAMGVVTQKILRASALAFSPFRGQKNPSAESLLPTRHLRVRIWGRKKYQTCAACQLAFWPALFASNAKGMNRLTRNQNHARVFLKIFRVIRIVEIPFIHGLIQAPAPPTRPHPIPNNAPAHAKKSSGSLLERSFRLSR